MLIVMPWTEFWMRNYFAYAWPWLGEYMAMTGVRGGVTAIGVVTAIAGIRDLLSALASRRQSDPAPSITPNGPRT